MSDLITALITPFNQEGEIDFFALEMLIEDQIAKGVTGFVVLGTTAEAELLTPEEQELLIATVCDIVKKRIPLTVGCAKSSTAEMLEFATAYNRFPIEQMLILVPPYLRPTQEGIYNHFKALSETSIPFLLYHHPLRTGSNPSMACLEKILSLPLCRGLKDASGGCEVMLKFGFKFKLYSGDDTLLLPHLSLGARGLISVSSHLIPEELLKIMNLFKQEPQKALLLFKEHQPLIETLFLEPNPIGVKGALSLLGKIENKLRAPYLSAKAETLCLLQTLLPNTIGSSSSSISV